MLGGTKQFGLRLTNSFGVKGRARNAVLLPVCGSVRFLSLDDFLLFALLLLGFHLGFLLLLEFFLLLVLLFLPSEKRAKDASTLARLRATLSLPLRCTLVGR